MYFVWNWYFAIYWNYWYVYSQIQYTWWCNLGETIRRWWVRYIFCGIFIGCYWYDKSLHIYCGVIFVETWCLVQHCFEWPNYFFYFFAKLDLNGNFIWGKKSGIRKIQFLIPYLHNSCFTSLVKSTIQCLSIHICLLMVNFLPEFDSVGNCCGQNHD